MKTLEETLEALRPPLPWKYHPPTRETFGAVTDQREDEIVFFSNQEDEAQPAEMAKGAYIAHAATLFPDVVDSLGWIVEFFSEHPEWFGEGKPEDGAEFEWLRNARKLLKKANKIET